METEVRFYYSTSSKEKLLRYFKSFNELNYKGRFYEITSQYNHSIKEYDFYTDKVDGRFRVRKTINENESKCMISWKRRIKDANDELIHNEEEIEVQINPNDYDNLCLLLENILHLKLVESYERYRSVFKNEDVEIVVDEYPFGVCVEIENKSKDKDAKEVIVNWLNKIKFNINDAYRLSWDDKYEELCKEQNKKIESIVTFNKDMPKIKDEFDKEIYD